MAAIEYCCTVTRREELTPTVFQLSFEADKPLNFQAGQFLSVVVPGAGPSGRDLRRAYSIASSPDTRPIQFCVKVIEEGPGSGYLGTLKPGQQFKAIGPYGDFVFEPKTGKNACFIATGTGVAPFRAMALSEHFLKNRPEKIWVLLGVRRVEEILYQEDFSGLQGMHFVEAVSQATPECEGFRGRVTDWLRQEGPDFPWAETEFYLCGNGPMIAEVKTLLLERCVAKTSIHSEIYYR